MANEVLYIRNTRPNAVLIRYDTGGGKTVKFTVERRGSREDTTALPAELRNDPVVASFLTRGIIEEISKDAFYALEARSEGRPAYALKTKANDVNIPMSDADSRTPMVIADKVIEDTKFLRSPQPEFAERVPSTGEEIATGIRQPLPEVKKKLSVATTKEERLEGQVSDLAAQVQAMAALLEKSLAANADTTRPEPSVEEEVAPRKPRATAAKSKKTTRKKT